MLQFGTLTFEPVLQHSALLARPTREFLMAAALRDVYVSEIDPSLSDTAAFCQRYETTPETAANCVVIEAKRGDRTWYAACVILGTSKADVNGIVRKFLGARKTSFAPMEVATTMTSMEYGGITPIGLPDNMPILIDTHVDQTPQVIIGSGVRKSKLLVAGSLLRLLPNAVVMDIIKR